MSNLSEYLSYRYKSINLVSDPIYSSMKFTLPSLSSNDETTERDLLNSKWLQRLRKIHQLQSTFWVFPSAEYSRFVTNPKVTMKDFRELNGYREVVPEYVKDYVSINAFI